MAENEKDKLLSMFAKTRALIKTEKNRENAMCHSVLEGAECYCNAIFLLLNNNYVFPARVLMRCLCELTIKLMWCLRCPDDTDEEQDRKTVDKTIRRWEKSTLAQQIILLDRWKQVDPKNNKIDDQKKDLEKKKDKMNVKQMPCYSQLLKELSDDSKSQIRKMSLELYKKFNNAVHLDAISLGEIYLQNNKTNVNNNDISELEKSCLVLARNITGVIAINK